MSATSSPRNVMSIGSILNQGSRQAQASLSYSEGFEASAAGPVPLSPASSEDLEPSLSSHKQQEAAGPPKPKYKRCKTGCQTCRNRRVKCDEAKPRCNRCISSKMKCCGSGYQHPADMAKSYRPWAPSYTMASSSQSVSAGTQGPRAEDAAAAAVGFQSGDAYLHDAIAVAEHAQGRPVQELFVPGFHGHVPAVVIPVSGGQFGAGHLWSYSGDS